MKKLFTIIFFSLLSLNLFSEEFSLFPWFCNQNDIYTQCINKGWKFQSDVSSKIPCYIFYTTDDVTYRGFPVFAVSFLFDENGIVASQSITFPKAFEATDTFPAVLELMLADKVQLLDKTYENNDIKKINYNGLINNSLRANYNIRGKDNLYQISVFYVNINP